MTRLLPPFGTSRKHYWPLKKPFGSLEYLDHVKNEVETAFKAVYVCLEIDHLLSAILTTARALEQSYESWRDICHLLVPAENITGPLKRLWGL